MKHLLTVAGSDSSGGAGLQADLKTFAAHGVYGMSVVTAVTAQNTCGVIESADLSPELVRAQLDAVFSDIRVDGVKIGMLSSAAIIRSVAGALREYVPAVVVLDPVMVSKSGYNLLQPEAERALVEELLPLVSLVTPNIPEAERLTGLEVGDRRDMVRAAERLMRLGARNVLLKGGHLTGSADDLLFDGSEHWFSGERIESRNTHGTGCTLSSALAANLALGLDLCTAVGRSKEYVTLGIRHGLAVGRGCGPVHHFVDLYEKAGWTE